MTPLFVLVHSPSAVRTVPGQHLHQVVDPPAVAAAIAGLADGPS